MESKATSALELNPLTSSQGVTSAFEVINDGMDEINNATKILQEKIQVYKKIYPVKITEATSFVEEFNAVAKGVQMIREKTKARVKEQEEIVARIDEGESVGVTKMRKEMLSTTLPLQAECEMNFHDALVEFETIFREDCRRKLRIIGGDISDEKITKIMDEGRANIICDFLMMQGGLHDFDHIQLGPKDVFWPPKIVS
jgi:hypothetical protein